MPHAKQETFHKSTARKKLFIGGNRSGKTVGGATEAVWWSTGTHPYRHVPEPPTYGRIVSVDFKQGVEKIVRPEIARWMPPSQIKGGSWEIGYDKTNRTLSLENGSQIEFMSYDQDIDKFAGTSRHWEWFDEEPPEDIWQECLMRLVDTGGSWWITMTPVEGMTWTYDKIYETANPNSPSYDAHVLVVEVESIMNPHLNPGEMDILLSGFDKEERSAREKGTYVQRGGLVYPNFKEEIHVVDNVDPRQLDPKDWLHFAMMDHGFSNATAWHWGAVDREGRKLIYREYHKEQEIVRTHARNVLAIEHEMGIIPSYRVGDPTTRNKDPITGTSVHVEYIEHGVVYILGNNDVPAGLDAVRRGFGGNGIRPTLFLTRNNEHAIWELKRYRFELWANKKVDRDKNKKEEPHKKDDHHVDAIRYGVASRPQKENLEIPEEKFNRPGSGAVNPYAGRTDPGTTSLGQEFVDDILGSEF